MGISPVAAIPKILTQTGLAKEDIDVYEVRPLFVCLILELLRYFQ